MRRINLPTLAVVGLVATAAVSFSVSHQVSALHKQVEAVGRDLSHKKEEIHILKAEWAYLSSPHRIEEIARKHLGMSDIHIKKPHSSCEKNGSILVFNRKK